MMKIANWMVLSLLALAAQAGAAQAGGPNVVKVTATDYAFEMPASLPAGPTRFDLTDAAPRLHHLTLVKLEQGKTLQDFTALPPGPPPSWAIFMGGPNAPRPHGGQTHDIVDLVPGNYAVICLIPDPDGKPHMMKGMVKALTVTPAAETRRMPAADLTLTLSNYAFSFSAPPAAGKQTWRVINHANQFHEAVIFRLEPGRTGEDIAQWVGGGMKGPPPGTPVAGVSPMSPSRDNVLMVDLSPGDYALLCFLPDAGNAKPHAMLGMIRNFKVL